jgi:hypothetical protein
MAAPSAAGDGVADACRNRGGRRPRLPPYRRDRASDHLDAVPVIAMPVTRYPHCAACFNATITPVLRFE